MSRVEYDRARIWIPVWVAHCAVSDDHALRAHVMDLKGHSDKKLDSWIFKQYN